MEMILKNGLEWSQMQMKRYKGKRIAGQEIPILTNTRAQEMLDRIPFWPTERQMLDKTLWAVVKGHLLLWRTSDHIPVI